MTAGSKVRGGFLAKEKNEKSRQGAELNTHKPQGTLQGDRAERQPSPGVRAWAEFSLSSPSSGSQSGTAPTEVPVLAVQGKKRNKKDKVAIVTPLVTMLIMSLGKRALH